MCEECTKGKMSSTHTYVILCAGLGCNSLTNTSTPPIATILITNTKTNGRKNERKYYRIMASYAVTGVFFL